MIKAREMVKWGVVCIATDYTHARGGQDRTQFGPSPHFSPHRGFAAADEAGAG
jgi:hypothetical protein